MQFDIGTHSLYRTWGLDCHWAHFFSSIVTTRRPNFFKSRTIGDTHSLQAGIGSPEYFGFLSSILNLHFFTFCSLLPWARPSIFRPFKYNLKLYHLSRAMVCTLDALKLCKHVNESYQYPGNSPGTINSPHQLVFKYFSCVLMAICACLIFPMSLKPRTGSFDYIDTGLNALHTVKTQALVIQDGLVIISRAKDPCRFIVHNTDGPASKLALSVQLPDKFAM